MWEGEEQAKGPGLAGPAKKSLATLDREWDGLIAHRDYPMARLDNNLAERTIRGPVVTRKNADGPQNPGHRPHRRPDLDRHRGRPNGQAEHHHLPDGLPRRMRPNGGKPLSGEALSRLVPWNASPEDLRTWAQPPPNGKTPDQ